MKKVKLSSGREIFIKEMSVDEIDDCKDNLEIIFADEGRIVRGSSKTRTKWIRKGLLGGDFKEENGNPFNGAKNKVVPDAIIKQLTDLELDECAMKIQEAQRMGEEKPSNSD